MPDYLDEGKIRELYEYDRIYASYLSCLETQLSELEEDKLHIRRVRQYAKADIRREIENVLSTIEKKLTNQIAQAQAKDTESIERISELYKAHIEAADEKAKQLRADAEATEAKRLKAYLLKIEEKEQKKRKEEKEEKERKRNILLVVVIFLIILMFLSVARYL